MKRILHTALAAALLPTLALANPLVETKTADNKLTTAPAQWLGKAPHLVVMGTAGGYPFDLQLTDLNDKNIHDLEVKREYLKTQGSYAPYQEIDLGLQIKLEGVAKTIEAKLTHADFNNLPSLPADFKVQSREEFPAGSRVFTEFEFEWEGGGKSVNAELANWRGLATVNLDDGYKADEPNADGMVGGYINAQRGKDTLVISFTLPVTEFEVED
ncbi:hypothetical protein GFB49_16955 [Epibacterium sp. SM1979]|uniref:Uncharacterized protein n=1 Tax=Tritonibacter litoralis TaxID=2662264 RepID=A0A843YFB7_9RHOB|nr:hypothetical protein [Tritonibacter litoralis]MQQ10160.1 hypothetical protein [Tritonibacter litoralis]